MATLTPARPPASPAPGRARQQGFAWRAARLQGGLRVVGAGQQRLRGQRRGRVGPDTHGCPVAQRRLARRGRALALRGRHRAQQRRARHGRLRVHCARARTPPRSPGVRQAPAPNTTQARVRVPRAAVAQLAHLALLPCRPPGCMAAAGHLLSALSAVLALSSAPRSMRAPGSARRRTGQRDAQAVVRSGLQRAQQALAVARRVHARRAPGAPEQRERGARVARRGRQQPRRRRRQLPRVQAPAHGACRARSAW